MSLEEMVGRQLVFGAARARRHRRRPPPLRGDPRGRAHPLSPQLRGPRALGAPCSTRLESALGRRLLVTTDHEGGRIIMLGARRDDLPRQPRRGHGGRGGVRGAAGADRGARAAPARRGRELRPGASTCSPSATARTSASAPTARIPSWSRASAPRASGACRRPASRPAPSTFPGRATRRWTRTWACPSSTPTGATCTRCTCRRSWPRWRPAWTAS